MLAKYRSIVSQRIPQCILTTFSTKKYTTATDNDFEAEPGKTIFLSLKIVLWEIPKHNLPCFHLIYTLLDSKLTFLFILETNFVKLIGSVWRDTVDLLGGDKSCKVIQYCTNENGEQFP